MFSGYPSYNPYRPLRLRDPFMAGEDVYALQTGLNVVLVKPLTADGVLGPATADGIVAGQRYLGLHADGVVGPLTWTKLVDTIGRTYRSKYGVAIGSLYGQIQHESGFFGGNYSRPPRPDGTFDAGVCQLNTKYHKPDDAFDVRHSIDFLARETRAYWDEFDGVTPAFRRANLAQGGHNAPAYARWYARNEGADGVNAASTRNPAKDGQNAVDKFNAYLADVSAYLRP